MKRSRRQRPALAVAAALAAATVLLSGCSGSATGRASTADAAAAPAPQAAGGAAAKAADTGAGSRTPATTAPTADARLIAYTAQLVLQTKDMTKALTVARELAGTGGGYVAGELVGGTSVGGEPAAAPSENGSGPSRAKLTLKVASASFQQTLDQLSALGSVVSRSSQADDLTQQVADVDSRVKSQQASVDRVRALMADAKSLGDVVSLESELSRRESDLESLQHQQQELSARTSLSTITLELRADAPAQADPPAKRHGSWGAVGGALAGGWHVLVAIVRGLLIALAAAAPFLVVLGVLGWLFRRRLRGLPSAAEAGRKFGLLPATAAAAAVEAETDQED